MKTYDELKRTIADVRALNRAKGFCFFEPKTLKFWRSKVHGGLIHGKYFITSEDNFNRTARPFTVRAIDWSNGDIETVGKFQQFETLADAKDYVKTLNDATGYELTGEDNCSHAVVDDNDHCSECGKHFDFSTEEK